MLLAWTLSVLNPAPRPLRRLGYVRQSGLLHARSRRCRAAWAPHLARARSVIASAATAIRQRRHAVVLGSGLLDDVPLDDLAHLFERVSLVDAVHPWPTRLAARRFPHVALVTAEISGGLSGAWADLCTDADLIVSANLLSQISLLPIEAYEARGREAPPRLGTHLVDTHLTALDTLAGRVERVCLITDTVQREEDRAGRTIDSADLLFGVTVPPAPEAWDWEIAPFGEIGRQRRLIHRVHAYPDWKAARRSVP